MSEVRGIEVANTVPDRQFSAVKLTDRYRILHKTKQFYVMRFKDLLEKIRKQEKVFRISYIKVLAWKKYFTFCTLILFCRRKVSFAVERKFCRETCGPS